MTTLPQLIANAVETDPEGVALVLADGTGPLEQVSYADLDAWSSRLARVLIERGIGPEDLVAVAVPRSLDAVLAVWAVAKTGAGFVPIDPAYPPGWVAHLLVDAGAVFGLAVSWVRNELPDEIEWLRVDTVDTARSLEQFSADPVTYADRVRPLRAEHPAYVSYVSDGETLPDGVVVTQAGLAGLCAEQQGRYRVEPEDRTLNFAPLPSDSAVLELLLALGGAATMVVVSPLVADAEELTELLRRTGTTHAYLPVDALPLIDPAGLDELGIVVTGRRPCPPELVPTWVVPVGDGGSRVLYQGYGPPEATVMTCISSPLTVDGPLTLGSPIRGVVARVLDRNLAPVADGAVGELYLGGPPLARGYHRRPGRTAQLLIADPFAEDGSRLYRTGDLVRASTGGDLEFVGRVEWVPATDSVPVRQPDRAERGPSAEPEAVAVPDEPAAVNGLPASNEPAAPGERPADSVPDHAQSLPVRNPAPQSPAEPVIPVRAEYEYATPTYGTVPDFDPEGASRAAAERHDLELPGRGHLEIPARQQELKGHGAATDEEPPATAWPAGERPETALPAAGSPVQRAEDAAVAVEAWRNSDQLPGSAETAPPHDSAVLASGDAVAFYENPLTARTGPEPEQHGPGRPAAGGADHMRPVPPPLPPRPATSESGAGPLWPAPGDMPPVPVESIALPAEPRPDRPEPIPLSPAQQRFWERNQTAPEVATDTVTAAMSLTGTLDATALQAAVADVVDRHETLRTVYPAFGTTPRQVVLPREQAVPEVVAEPVPGAELGQWLQLLAYTDFDTADPEQVPVRFALAELGPREHVVAVVVHRILADDASAELLLRDLLRAFLGRRNRSRPLWQPLSVQYLDYFLRRRAALGDPTDPESPAARRLVYWREQLADLPPRLALPGDGRRPDSGVLVHTFDIGARTHRRIAEITRRTGASEFLVLRTVLTVLLARSVAVTDIVLGSSVRGHDEHELDDAIGPYANTVVLRTRVDPTESFLDLVQRVAGADRAAFAHADLPFELLVAALELDCPLFDVTIALQHNDIPRLEMPSLATAPVETVHSSTGETLRLVVDPHSSSDGSPDGIAAAFHFAGDRIGALTVAEFARRFQRILTVAGGDPDVAVGDIDLLSRADLDGLLWAWNDTRYPVAPELLLDGYRRTVTVRPDTVAVTDTESELTYRQFDARVNQLARRLIAAGVGAETRVGVAVRYSPDLVVAIYAVLTAGGAYLPVDPLDPPQWHDRLLDTVRPKVVLVDGPGAARLAAALRTTGQSTPVLVIDDDDLSTYSAEPVATAELLRPVRPDNAAAVLCASVGADGPEPAVLSHGALNNQITLLLTQSPLGFTDIYLQRTRASYDTSLWGFFLPLRAGAQLVLADPARSGNPAAVAESIAAHGVTVADFGPSQLAGFTDLVDPDRMGSLREIFVTGGSLASQVVARLRARSGARLHNTYGTCETAVAAVAWPAAGSTDPAVPIGLPQWNTRVYVLDPRLRPVPPGVPGELYLAGDQLARGYTGRAGVTADRFVANPFGIGQRMYRTGDVVRWREATDTTPQRLDLLGRTDDQLRFRGQRVCPQTLAALLRTLPEVADAAVLPRSSAPVADAPAGARAVAYVVPTRPEPDLVRIRADLARLLPADLVPAGFQLVTAIPRGPDGAPATDLLPDADGVPLLDPLSEPVVPDEEIIASGAPAPAADLAGSPVGVGVGLPAGADAAAVVAEAHGAGSAAAAAPGPVGGLEATSSVGSSGAAEFSGELPATPTAVRLLDNPIPGVEVRSIVLDLPAGEPLQQTEATVRALVLRHPLLWARLVSSGESPMLVIPSRDQRGDRQYWWRGPETGENAVATDDVVQAAADALDPATGRNIHFVTTGAEPTRRLVVVANGVVVDDRSWRILIDELRAGDTAVSAPETRLSQLAQALDQRARSIDLLDEAGWWRRNLAGARTAPPLASADLRARRRVSLAITAEGTAAVSAAADAYRAAVPEVLLTAFAIALRTSAQDTVARSLGSLVRYDADARSLVSRSENVIGGFVTEFPLSVQLTDFDTDDALVGGPAAGHALTQIRDLVRSVPGGGTGYALLRYLNPETTAEFAAADSGRCTLRYRDLRPARVHTDGPADGVPLALTVDATDDGLLCRFDYATDVFVGDDVKTFAEHWVRALGGLAEHGLRPDAARTATPAPPSGGAPRGSPGPEGQAPGADLPAADARPSAGPPLSRADGKAADAPMDRASADEAPASSPAESVVTGGLGEAAPGAELPAATAPADPLAAPGLSPGAEIRPGRPAASPVAQEIADSAADRGGPFPGPVYRATEGTAGPDSTDPEPLSGAHSADGQEAAGRESSADVSLPDTGTSWPQPSDTPAPDAETTSLLRPVTDPQRGSPTVSGLPQRRPRGDRASADLSIPEGLPQREPGPQSGSRPAAEFAPASGLGLPQRRPSNPDPGASPEAPSGSPGLPQRRPSNGGHDTAPEEAASPGVPGVAPQQGLRSSTELGSAEAASDGPDPAVPGLPQRRPSNAGHGTAPEASPSSSDVLGVLPQRGLRSAPGSPASASDPVSDSPAAVSGLPQRRPLTAEPVAPGSPATGSEPDEPVQAGPDGDGGSPLAGLVSPAGLPGLPQRRPQSAEQSPDSGANSWDVAPSGELPRRPGLGSGAVGEPGPVAEPDSAELVARYSTELPRHRPRTASAAPPAPGEVTAGDEPAALPQRRRASTTSTGSDATTAAAEPADFAPRPGPDRAAKPVASADPEPTTFLRPVADVETTAYLSPVRDRGLGAPDETTLLSLFDEQVARTPDVPAVRQGARLLSYAELDRKSRALSVELIRFGVGAQTPVAVAMRPGIDLVVAVFAVLRAGGAYIPLDPGGPAAELDRVLASAAPICVLSTSDDAMSTETGVPVVAMDLLYLDLPVDPAADPLVVADDIADIRYFPDNRVGVTTTHRQLVERLRRAQRSHPYDSADLVLHAAPTVTEITLWELFRPLNSGAQILMPDHPGRAADLSRSIAAHKVTIVHVVPALLDRFLDSVTDGGGRSAHPSLHRVVVDGAALPAGGVERFMTVLPRAELVIWYGHNETGVITVGSVGGRPVTNDRVYLLDDQLRPVAPGAAGEMYIGGPQLGRGYYDDPAATAVRFVATAGGGRLYRTGDIVRRREGVLEYLGRAERIGGSLTVGS